MLDHAMSIGQRCGKYRIISILGSGGVAEVYKATNVETDSLVALKCLRPCHNDNRYVREHMAAEGALLGGLRHANVVCVYDVGIDNDVLWVAMEFLSGTTLRALLRGGKRLPVNEALRYAREIADGVAAAHEMRVIHRDLKPENVMITSQNEVKVLDMGAAKFVGWDMIKTATGSIFGTPLYMSPEQLLEQPVDARSDVYALGLILYEMIAGRHPIIKALGSSPGPYEVAVMQLHNAPPALSSFVPECPEVVSNLVDRAIAKDRDRRPSSMPEFAQLIRRTIQRLYAQTPEAAEVKTEPLKRDKKPAAASSSATTSDDNGKKSNRALADATAAPAVAAINAKEAPSTAGREDDDEELDDADTQVFYRSQLAVDPPDGRGGEVAQLDPERTNHGTLIMARPANGYTAPTKGRNGNDVAAPTPIFSARANAEDPTALGATSADPHRDAESHYAYAVPTAAGSLHALDDDPHSQPAALLLHAQLMETSLRVFLGAAMTALSLLLIFGRVFDGRQRASSDDSISVAAAATAAPIAVTAGTSPPPNIAELPTTQDPATNAAAREVAPQERPKPAPTQPRVAAKGTGSLAPKGCASTSSCAKPAPRASSMAITSPNPFVPARPSTATATAPAPTPVKKLPNQKGN